VGLACHFRRAISECQRAALVVPLCGLGRPPLGSSSRRCCLIVSIISRAVPGAASTIPARPRPAGHWVHCFLLRWGYPAVQSAAVVLLAAQPPLGGWHGLVQTFGRTGPGGFFTASFIPTSILLKTLLPARLLLKSSFSGFSATVDTRHG
jgi:hypothetical protein